MARLRYDLGESYGESTYPRVYSGGGAREVLREAMQRAWSSPDLQALRSQLSAAAQRTLAPGYANAARSLGLGRSYSQVARSSGADRAYAEVWGSVSAF